MNAIVKVAVSFAFSLTLAACGDGASESSSQIDEPQVPVQEESETPFTIVTGQVTPTEPNEPVEQEGPFDELPDMEVPIEPQQPEVPTELSVPEEPVVEVPVTQIPLIDQEGEDLAYQYGLTPNSAFISMNAECQSEVLLRGMGWSVNFKRPKEVSLRIKGFSGGEICITQENDSPRMTQGGDLYQYDLIDPNSNGDYLLVLNGETSNPQAVSNTVRGRDDVLPVEVIPVDADEYYFISVRNLLSFNGKVNAVAYTGYVGEELIVFRFDADLLMVQ